ncbi:MAG: UbiA family prenyltransferase, partial [Gammaproteobacteria bacterium]|nr:UbiA family prenyltransferase [Gammaproteobacteria bacterium]
MIKLRTIAEIVRIIDVILIGGAVVVGGYFGAGVLRVDQFIAALSAGLIAAGGYTINDWCDEKVDQINKPQRPIPSGRISKSQALLLAFILQMLGFILSLWLNYPAVWIALLWVVLVNLYSFVLQNIPLLGNVTTAFMLAMTFVYGGVAVGNIDNIWPLVTFIFLGNVSREIIKDIEDLPGDSFNNVNTLA